MKVSKGEPWRKQMCLKGIERFLLHDTVRYCNVVELY
eukprot:UN17776